MRLNKSTPNETIIAKTTMNATLAYFEHLNELIAKSNSAALIAKLETRRADALVDISAQLDAIGAIQ